YLTGNLLTGQVPSWTQKADNLNLFSSSSTRNDSGMASCLTSFVCPKTSWYALHINCGGRPITVNGSAYDDDSEAGGPARFHQSGIKNWAFSTTGNFMDNDSGDYYTWSNKSTLSLANPELFTDARVSPTSLTYYGFCMGNGNY
ncbi:LRR receptor-like kinase, partial [Trifolium medium]|nr:LRR receptor-like kinase [Trifolium medium]